jgi:serine/threonine protein kinase
MADINRQFGRYLIIRFLGSGATSDVFLAHDNTLGRDVALKILKPALVSDRTSFDRFSKEAEAASKMFHNNIATVLDMGDLDGHYYLAMRYAEGMSLDQFLRKNGPLPWDGVKKLIQQIGSALVQAHSQGYIHRDIKPNNIMVSSTGNFILTDFGLTRAMLDSGMTTTTGVVLGTPPYIPPEIWNGKEAGPFSDEYSFACVIDEAITGRALFSGATPQEIITKHLVTPPEISIYPPEIPSNVRLIIQKALSKDSSDRFPDMQSFIRALIDPGNYLVAADHKQAALRQQPISSPTVPEAIPVGNQQQPVSYTKGGETPRVKKQRKSISITVGIFAGLLILVCLVGGFFLKNSLFPQAGPSNTPTQQSQGSTSVPAVVVPEIPSLSPTTDKPQLADTWTPMAVDTSTPYPTYTQLPTYTQQPVLPVIQTATFTLEPNLLFSDNFDNEINPAYWQRFGTWMVVNGMPVLVEGYKSDNKYPVSAFNWGIASQGGLLFPATANLDNIAIEFDLGKRTTANMFLVLLAYKDEYNFKKFLVDNSSNSSYFDQFAFCTNGNCKNIPQSLAEFSSVSQNHIRIEIRGNSLSVYMNKKLVYDYKDLPETVSGEFGLGVSSGTPEFDNFKIYQLP